MSIYASFIKYLMDSLAGDGDCLGTLGCFRVFCEEHGLDFEAMQAELAGHGIVEDCEVILHLVGLDLDIELPGV